MDSNYSLADIASVAGGGMSGGNSWIWIFALLILVGMGGGGLFGNNGYGQYATAASQNEILSGQKFDALSRQINQVGDGLCSSTYALNNSIQGEGRALQTQISNVAADTNAVTVAQTQKILDAIAQNKIDSLQAQVSELKTQNMFCGIPKINPYGYGVYAYNACGNSF